MRSRGLPAQGLEGGGDLLSSFACRLCDFLFFELISDGAREGELKDNCSEAIDAHWRVLALSG